MNVKEFVTNGDGSGCDDSGSSDDNGEGSDDGSGGKEMVIILT